MNIQALILLLLALAPLVTQAQRREDELRWMDRRNVYWYYRYKLLTQFMEESSLRSGPEERAFISSLSTCMDDITPTAL